jgi:hypothetical protein
MEYFNLVPPSPAGRSRFPAVIDELRAASANAPGASVLDFLRAELRGPGIPAHPLRPVEREEAETARGALLRLLEERGRALWSPAASLLEHLFQETPLRDTPVLVFDWKSLRQDWAADMVAMMRRSLSETPEEGAPRRRFAFVSDELTAREMEERLSQEFGLSEKELRGLLLEDRASLKGSNALLDGGRVSYGGLRALIGRQVASPRLEIVADEANAARYEGIALLKIIASVRETVLTGAEAEQARRLFPPETIRRWERPDGLHVPAQDLPSLSERLAGDRIYAIEA